ncbi:SipW-dependent-type signal peptide-containing protein [Nocardioides sp. LHG3406-4]|uniref:SipW-dependent-type signal peptide-containing protein n=1 Tax=Nocardioides sp. LHG3406-4 TaxID=2804575 RepID=UPI003CF0818F
MTDRTPTDRTPAEGRLTAGPTTSQRIRALLSLGVLLGLGATSTMAAWTDDASATSGAFVTGTLDLKLGDPAVDDNPPEFSTVFSMADMAPGSSKDAVLRVVNSGSLPFTFTASSAATNSGGGADQLGSALRLAVYPSSSAGACTGAAIVPDGPANGPLLPAQPALADGATRDLCFQATLPATAVSALQDTTSIVTITLIATTS